MPSQGHLFVGERVRTFEDVVRIAGRLGWSVTVEELEQDAGLESQPRQVSVRGRDFEVVISLHTEGEEAFPASESDGKYTSALVGFELTSRYKGCILDADEESGAPEPFEIDLDAAQEVLRQTREWWPEAHVLIMTRWH